MRACAAVPALLLSVSAAFGAESVFLDVRSEATVDQASVILADIARVVARDASVAEQLGRMPVARCASFIRECRIQIETVSGPVEARAAELGANVVWGANRSVVVNGRPKVVSLVPAIDRGAAWVLQAYGQGAPVYVSVVDGVSAVTVPPGALQVLPEPARMRRVGAYIEMPVRVLVDGMEVAQPQVRYVVQRGAQSVDVPALPVAQSIEVAPIATTARALPSPMLSDQPLVRSESGNAVVKDQRVRLLIESGSVRVEAEGVALGDAKVGGDVKVRRANGLATVTGRAIDHQTVQIVEN